MTVKRSTSERGMTLIEVLVALFILSIMGLAVANASTFALEMREKAIRDSLSAQLAQEELEAFAASNPLAYEDGESSSHTFTRNGLTFTLETEVSVNDDDSRTIDVTVKYNSAGLANSITLSNTFSPWELS